MIAIIFTYFLVGWLFDFLKPFDAHCDYLMRMRGMMGTKHDMLHFNHFENTISNFLLKKKNEECMMRINHIKIFFICN